MKHFDLQAKAHKGEALGYFIDCSKRWGCVLVWAVPVDLVLPSSLVPQTMAGATTCCPILSQDPLHRNYMSNHVSSTHSPPPPPQTQPALPHVPIMLVKKQ